MLEKIRRATEPTKNLRYSILYIPVRDILYINSPLRQQSCSSRLAGVLTCKPYCVYLTITYAQESLNRNVPFEVGCGHVPNDS